MSNSDMASKLIAVIVEQRNQIVELESQISKIDKANTDLLGQYVEAAERANAKPDPPEPEDEVKTVLCPDCGNVIEVASNTTKDTYLGDFRVLKTAMEIVSYAMESRSRDWELAICEMTRRYIKSFTENVRLWNGLDDLEPYLWSSLGSGEEHLVDREWKK